MAASKFVGQSLILEWGGGVAQLNLNAKVIFWRGVMAS